MSSTDERKILKPFPLHTLLSSLQIFWINQVGKKVLNLFPYPSTIYSLFISTCQKYMFRWFKIFANHFQIVTYILLEMKLQSSMEKLNSKKFQDLKKKRLCWLSFNRRLFFWIFLPPISHLLAGNNSIWIVCGIVLLILKSVFPPRPPLHLLTHLNDSCSSLNPLIARCSCLPQLCGWCLSWCDV